MTAIYKTAKDECLFNSLSLGFSMTFVNLPLPSPITSDNVTNQALAVDQHSGRSIALEDEGFAVTWLDRQDGDFKVRLITPGGRETGDLIRIAAPEGAQITDAYNIAAGKDGTMWIAAQVEGGISQSDKIVVTRIDLDGANGDISPTWFFTDRGATGAQIFPSVAVQANGRAIASWIEVPAGQSFDDATLTLTGNVRATILDSPERTPSGVFSVNNLEFGGGGYLAPKSQLETMGTLSSVGMEA